MITAKLDLVRNRNTLIILTIALAMGFVPNWSFGQGLTVRSSSQSRKPQRDKPELKPSISPSTSGTSVVAPMPLEGVRYSNPVRNKWKVGVKVRVGSGAVRNATFTFPIPKDWPEQTVSVVEDEIPSNAIVEDSRSKDPGLEQMVIRFPSLGPGQELLITRTYLVTTSQVDPPLETGSFVKPSSRNQDARKYLKISPGIKFQNTKIKKQVKQLTADQDNVWSEVEAIFDWVRDSIEDTADKPKPLMNVFLEKTGCNEDKVSLFVGMCRSHKIPARMVWVQGTIYAEFMLADRAGNVFWFPCNISGVREFGSYAEPRIVLQKGDNFRVPEKDETLKYVGEVFQGQVKKGSSRPKYAFFRQLLPAE